MSADLTAAEALPSTRDAVENQFSLLVATDFRELRKTLSNVLTSDELTRRYAEALGNPTDHIAAGKNVAVNPLIRGAALFIIFHYTATASDTPDRQLLDAISSREEFRDFIIKFYDIPSEIGLAKLSFHMAGTTSFIFKVQIARSNPVALKLIQAPFINLQGIRVATSGYRERFGTACKIFAQHYSI